MNHVFGMNLFLKIYELIVLTVNGVLEQRLSLWEGFDNEPYI